MEYIFKRQSEIIKNIERICINFSKDGASRKTKEYIEKRLLALDSLWGEFDSNNEILSADEDMTHEYFSKNIFVHMKSYFETERKKMADYPIPSTSSNDAENSDQEEDKFYIPISNADPQFDKSRIVDDLLTQQRTNFRALSRIVDRIVIDSLEEKWEIEDQLKELQRRWRAIDEQHLRIDNYLQGHDQRYEREFQNHEEKFHYVKKQLNQKLNSTTCLQQSTPKVEIPVFTGKYSQWPTFFDLFKETIDNNNSLNKAQKLQHLKGKLKGEAERLVQHLNISTQNYDTAWDILTHRYNNVNVLFTHQIEIFYNQPNVTKQTSYELKRLHDTTMETIHAIHNLGVDTSTWDPLLVHLVAKKLDAETYKDYKEARRAPRELPSFDELMSFIESKFVALEPINKKEKDATGIKFNPSSQISRAPHFKPGYQNSNRSGKSYQAAPILKKRCLSCKSEHDLWQCKRFLNLPTESKIKFLTKLQVCRNCLYQHKGKQCMSKYRCRYCKGEHNSIIHDDNLSEQNMQPSTSQSESTMSRSSSPLASTVQPTIPKSDASTQPSNKHLNVNYVAADDEEILLTTVLLKIKTRDNAYIVLRGLLDQGSQISLLSEHAAQLLGLQRQSYNACVSGIGVLSKSSRGIVTLECESIYGDYSFTTQALVMSKVINQLPNVSFKKTSWPHLQNINLADPEYNVSKPIDLLLDASVYSDIIMSGLIKGSPQAPIAQQTKLGWILSGNVKTFNCNVVINEIDDISRFWEVEDISQPPQSLTESEQYCENYYVQTTRRLDCGRYEVALPMKRGFEQYLGTSKLKAISQFKHLEKRMTNNHSLSSAYINFMREYETLRHMRPAERDTTLPTCYLPHHGVLKMDSTTTKLRVVFNASSKTSTGKSLNDLMECGPNLQQDLQALILRWRTHKYVVTADIEKMFRQFLIRECDQPLLSVVWRESPQELLQEYHLTTVTYGTKAAPFLAMRTLRQIAKDNVVDYPLAADAIENCFYTDDLMSGHDSITQIKILQTQLIDVLKSAGLNLQVNDLVLIKEDNLPPGKWAMGRVCELHPGKDGYVRVVTLKSQNNTLKRPITKLILLPVNGDSDMRPSETQAASATQNDISSNRSTRPQKKPSCFNFVSLAILLFMAMISPSLQQTTRPYENTILQTQQSLYFDRIAELQHIRDEWRLIIYYNMSTYWDGLSNIKYKYLSYLKTMCHNQYTQYESIVLQLEHEMQEIKHYNSLLVDQTNRRQKRGLINGVGYMANSLFGVLDERFAEQYREDIEKVTKNENHLQNLIKNQTLIIESQYNILRRNERTMNSQLTSINQHLANISMKISNMRSDAENNVYITTSILAINIIVSYLRRIQETIINTLTDINHGRIDTHLLPPEQLEQQISIIQGQLHGDLTLPIDKYNAQQLYKLIKARARMHKDYLIIEVRIPLVSNELYELDQIITIPQQHGDKVQYTIPIYPYIVFNINRDSAFLLSEIDVQSCLHTQSKVICSIDKPIYELKSKQSICDIKLLHTDKPAHSPCAVQLSPCEADKWIKLHRQNSWLYSCCKQCNIRIYCAAGMEIKTLLGNGILNLSQGCTVKGETFTILSHQNYFSHTEGRPDEVKVPETSVLNTIINTSVSYDSVPVQETDPQIWKKMKAQIDQLKSDSSESINLHDVHHYVLQYVLLAGLSAVIIVIMFLWRKHRRASQLPSAVSEPAPPPRAATRLSLQNESTEAPKFDP